MRAASEYSFALREPGHQEQGRVDTETERNSLKKTAAPSTGSRVGVMYTKATCRVRHVFGAELAN